MAIGGAPREAKAKKGHAVARAPSPPIRYELWSNEATQKTPRSGQSKRKAGRQQKASFSSRFANFGRSKTGGNKAFGSDDEDDNSDDNISLLSMTGLIADDFCQLQNFHFDNIGPNIREPDNNEINNKNAVPVIKSYSPALRDNQPRQFAGYGTPETRSMNSDPEVHPPLSQQMEVRVVDEESDNISEITPTGCAGFDGGRAERRRRNKRNNNTTYESNDQMTGCCGNEITPTQSRSKENPDESFHGVLVSMVTCTPSPDEIRSIRRSFSDDHKGTGTTPTNSRGIFFDDNNTEHENRSINNSRSFDGSNSNNNSNGTSTNRTFDSSTFYGNRCQRRLGNRGPVPSSIVSAKATSPVFKNNSDRYNQLVVGLRDTNLNGERTPSNVERQHRKYTPAWFKSKRRNHPKRLISPTRADGMQRNANVEVVWKHSGTPQDIRRPATTTEGFSPQCKQSRLKQLLTRGRSKERKRQQPQQEEQREATAVRAVGITETDPNRWKPGQDQHKQHQPRATKTRKGDACSAQTSESLTIGLCNADTALKIAAAAASAAAGDYPGERRVASRGGISRRTRSKERTVPPLGPFATKTYVPPSEKIHGPVWRGDQDSDFHPRWPNTEPEVFPSVSLVTNDKTNPLRKNRIRCNHRNLEAVDIEDDESFPTTKWTQNRSYDEDNCEHGDVHVLSIVGHHDGLSEQRRKGGSSHPIAAGSPFSARHQHNLAQQPRRNLPPSERIGSASSSTNSATSTSASATSSFSSSSTSFSRRRLGDRSENLRILGESDEASRFAVGDAATSPKVHSPWRKDYETYIASKNDVTGTRSPRPLTPPKIKRTVDPHTCFDVDSDENGKESPRLVGIPSHRRMLV